MCKGFAIPSKCEVAKIEMGSLLQSSSIASGGDRVIVELQDAEQSQEFNVYYNAGTLLR
jgi:hypothetical protein